MDNIIKMLRAPGAEWIQESWVPKVGDRTDKGFILGWHNSFIFLADDMPHAYSKEDLLYLPSIEDYLGMVEGNIQSVLNALTMFNLYHAHSTYTTWETLMLGFVQHKVQSLKWNGEGWR